MKMKRSKNRNENNFFPAVRAGESLTSMIE